MSCVLQTCDFSSKIMISPNVFVVCYASALIHSNTFILPLWRVCHCVCVWCSRVRNSARREPRNRSNKASSAAASLVWTVKIGENSNSQGNYAKLQASRHELRWTICQSTTHPKVRILCDTLIDKRTSILCAVNTTSLGTHWSSRTLMHIRRNSTSGALSAHQEVQKQNAEVSTVYRKIFENYSLARSWTSNVWKTKA